MSTTPEAQQLAPCPFCGSAPTLVPAIRGHRAFIECPRCETGDPALTNSQHTDSAVEAVHNWNTRAQPPVPDAIGLANTLWAMAQGRGPIEEVTALMAAEISRARALITRMQAIEDDSAETPGSDVTKAAAGFTDEEWAAYEKTVAEDVQRDAQRYRHMRANAAFQDRYGPGLYWYLPRIDRGLPVGERLDNAIDAELNSAARKGGEAE